MARITQISRKTEQYYAEIGKLSLIPEGIEKAQQEGRQQAAEKLFNRAYELCYNSYIDIQAKILPEIRDEIKRASGLGSRFLYKRLNDLEFEMMAVANAYARTMHNMLKEYMHLHDFKFTAPEKKKKSRAEGTNADDWDFEEPKKQSGYDGWLNPDLRYRG